MGGHRCPACGSGRLARIVYGLVPPDAMGELRDALDRGKIVLGGCLMTGDNPAWRCRACGREWLESAVAPADGKREIRTPGYPPGEGPHETVRDGAEGEDRDDGG